MPAPQNKPEIRRSQLITTYGVGSIVAAGDESFMIAGIDSWPIDEPDLHEPRLERHLRVDGFALPPATDNPRGDIPVVRFPKIHYCPECRRLKEYDFFAPNRKNECPRCNATLVPSRFIVACNRGHVDDFPYFLWVHKGTPPTDEKRHELSIQTGGVTASLQDIVIRCSCGKARTLYGAFGREAMIGITQCKGTRPWLGDNEPCTEIPRTLQRGATNVYFAVVESALSIPPWSEAAFKKLDRYWPIMKSASEELIRNMIDVGKLAQGTAYTTDQLVRAALERQRREAPDDADAPLPPADDSLKSDEYIALLEGKPDKPESGDFVSVPGEVSADAATWLDKVMLVKRLREVRVLESFTRLLPPEPGDPPERRAPLAARRMKWLPAVEVSGEGIFLKMNMQKLEQWEARPEVLKRASRIRDNYLAKFARLGRSPDREISSRLILIHTLAHSLIIQWSLECGYPAASLRERLYVSDTMAGLLIYTASGDSAGSLGGIIALGESGRLNEAVAEAIERSSWCSSDPLCIEASAAGVDALNLAACHACVLLPEVSCEHSNTLLDRGLLVGSPDEPSVGFFEFLLPGA